MNLNEAKKILMNISNLTKDEQEAVKMIISALDKINDNEEWRDVVGYEGFYRISNLGRVKSFKYSNEKLLKIRINRKGYPYVGLYKDNIEKFHPIHQLVAQAFIPNPENKPQVNHKDGNKQNNLVENLEWATESENRLHAYKIGLQPRNCGAENINAKLSEEDVIYIRKNYKPRDKKFGRKALAKKFDVNEIVIKRVANGKTYKNISLN